MTSSYVDVVRCWYPCATSLLGLPEVFNGDELPVYMN